ncbi:unnamed protein product, partial [Rotaria sordida]
ESIAIGLIYDQELARANFSQAGLAVSLSSQEAKSSLNKLRRKTTPILPDSSDFDIPDLYSTTIDSRRFLLGDLTYHRKRILIFSTDEQLTVLFKAKQIMMDGTFNACPPYFEQVYTLHCIKHGKSFPCAIALLGGKSTNIYKQLFNELETHATRLQLDFDPTAILSDFEKALLKAVREKFPQATHHACYFHFCQAVYRKIQNLGLATHYRDDEHIRDTCRQLMSLALLPCREVEFAFEEIVSKAPPLLLNLIDYFRNFWFRQMPVELWNVHNLDIRTNNNAEGWHNRFNRRINKTHPNVWHFISTLKQEEVYFRQQILHMKSGKNKNRSKKVCAMQDRLNALSSRFDNQEIDVEEYLQVKIMVKFVLTGSTGELGSSVLRHLLELGANPKEIILSVYNPKGADPELAKIVFDVRHGDYKQQQTLEKAFQGAEILFLVSSTTMIHEKRTEEHRNAIEAAKNVGI